MANPFPYPIVDHHAHLRPGGSGLEAARRFAAKGGTHLFLATQNYLDHAPSSLEEYRDQFETTLRLARGVEEATKVRVYPVLAPFPVDLVHLASQRPLAECEQIQIEALDLARRHVKERRCVALGEVGSAHFPVDEPIRATLERVLRHALQIARDEGCPVVLHTADLDEEGYAGLARIASEEALPLRQMVKHYARAYHSPEARHGVIPSFLAQRDLIRAALPEGGTWFLETDYLDDPARPGAVLALDTIPRRVTWLCASEAASEYVAQLRTPFVDAPKKVYGLDLEAR